MKTSEIYTIESFVNTFIYHSYVIEENQEYTFIISPELNQSEELFSHLTRGGFFHIGFNNLRYHYIILHHFLNNFRNYKYESGLFVSGDLHLKSDQLRNSEEIVYIPNNEIKIIQIDLKSLFHLNYKGKNTTLNDVKFMFHSKDLNEILFPSEYWVKEDEVEVILDKCKSDVLAIYNLYCLTRGKSNNPVYSGVDELKLRSGIRKQFGLKCYN